MESGEIENISKYKYFRKRKYTKEILNTNLNRRQGDKTE